MIVFKRFGLIWQKKYKPTIFEGYTESSISSEVISIIQDNNELDKADRVNQEYILIKEYLFLWRVWRTDW